MHNQDARDLSVSASLILIAAAMLLGCWAGDVRATLAPLLAAGLCYAMAREDLQLMSEQWRETIRLEIDRQGRTQRELADLIAVHECSISRYLLGKQQLSAESLQRLADALGLELTAAAV